MAAPLEPQFVFSPAIFDFLLEPSKPTAKTVLTQKRGTKKDEWKHNQWRWFHWLFIIRWGWGPVAHYLIIHLENTVKFSLPQDFIRLHIVVLSSITIITTLLLIRWYFATYNFIYFAFNIHCLSYNFPYCCAGFVGCTAGGGKVTQYSI